MAKNGVWNSKTLHNLPKQAQSLLYDNNNFDSFLNTSINHSLQQQNIR